MSSSTDDLIRQLEEQRAAFLALEQRVHTALRQQEASRAQDESPSSPTFSDGIGRQSTISFAEPSRKSTGIASLLQSSAMSVDSDDEDDETYYVGRLLFSLRLIGPSSDHLELLRLPLGTRSTSLLRFARFANPLHLKGTDTLAAEVVSRRGSAHPLEDLRMGVVRPNYSRRGSP